MAVPIERTVDYHKNMAQAGGDIPCVVCGRGIKDGREYGMIRVNIDWEASTDEEADASLEHDQGSWPIGRDCARQHPELKPYISR